jgi:hypothetical protein
MTNPTQPPNIPAALLAEWIEDLSNLPFDPYTAEVAARGATWAWHQRTAEVQQAADAELEACRKVLKRAGWHRLADDLLFHRRPPSPTLRERALVVLADDNRNRLSMEDLALIREALQEGDSTAP